MDLGRPDLAAVSAVPLPSLPSPCAVRCRDDLIDHLRPLLSVLFVVPSHAALPAREARFFLALCSPLARALVNHLTTSGWSLARGLRGTAAAYCHCAAFTLSQRRTYARRHTKQVMELCPKHLMLPVQKHQVLKPLTRG